MTSRLTASRCLAGIEVAASLAGTAFIVSLLLRTLTHAGGLWRDEAAILHLVESPSLADLWSLLEYEAFPLLWYLVLRTWVAFGGGASDFSLRCLAFLVSLGTVALIWWCARRLNSSNCEESSPPQDSTRSGAWRPAVPLLSLALAGACPDLYQFGGSLRAYGLGMLLMLWTLSAVWRLVQFPTPRHAAVAMLAAVLSVQCLYYNALMLFATCLAGVLLCLLRRQGRRAVLVLAVGGVAALSLIPYLGIFRRVHAFNMLVKSDVIDPVSLMTNLVTAIDPRNTGVRWIWLTVGLLIFAAFLKHIIVRWREPWTALHDRQLYLGAALLLAFVCQIGFLWLLSYQTSNSGWYYLTVLVYAPVVGDSFLFVQGVRRTVWRVVRLSLAVAALSLNKPVLWEATGTRMTSIDTISRTVEEKADKNDLVVVTQWWMGISFQRYYHGAAPWETLPPISDHRAHRYDLLKEQMSRTEPLAPLLQRVEETLRGGHRVWVVGATHFLGPEAQLQPLPPAPHSLTGWKEEPYLRYWRVQFSQLLRQKGSRYSEVPIPLSGPVFSGENPPLGVCEGSL